MTEGVQMFMDTSDQIHSLTKDDEGAYHCLRCGGIFPSVMKAFEVPCAGQKDAA
jgi:hypothetical protein